MPLALLLSLGLPPTAGPSVAALQPGGDAPVSLVLGTAPTTFARSPAGLSVVVPSFSRPENVVGVLDDLLRIDAMNWRPSEGIIAHGSSLSLNMGPNITSRAKAQCGSACDMSKVRHLDLIAENDGLYVSERFLAGAEARYPVVLHMDDDIRVARQASASLVEGLHAAVAREEGFPDYSDGKGEGLDGRKFGLYGPQERQCGVHGYSDPHNHGGPASFFQNKSVDGAPTIVLTKFAATSRAYSRQFARRLRGDYGALMKLTRGNGEDIVFGTALRQRGGVSRQLRPSTDDQGFDEANGGWQPADSHLAAERRETGYTAYSDSPTHFAQRGRICYCLAKGLLREELAECTRQGWS